MNKPRRKAISEVIKRLEALNEEFQSIKEDIEILKGEEEEYMENIPENLQQSERYEKAEESVFKLESAVDFIEFIDIDEIILYLGEAME